MKHKTLTGLMAVGLLLGGLTLTANAGNGPGNGRGYGGPPQSDTERAARQAACQEKNGGVCPNGGPRANCQGAGKGGFGKGYGQGARKGLRDGTGPRSANGACPNTPAKSGK